MKHLTILALILTLTGCQFLKSTFGSVGAVECSAGYVTYCAAQLKAEQAIHTNIIERIDSSTRVDLVHVCAFAQCEVPDFILTGEAGDFTVLQVTDRGAVGLDDGR